jgi:hypothetical protein
MPRTLNPHGLRYLSCQGAVSGQISQEDRGRPIQGRQALVANRIATTFLINRFLMAYEHTFFDIMVPRHRLDGRPILLVTHERLLTDFLSSKGVRIEDVERAEVDPEGFLPCLRMGRAP